MVCNCIATSTNVSMQVAFEMVKVQKNSNVCACLYQLMVLVKEMIILLCVSARLNDIRCYGGNMKATAS